MRKYWESVKQIIQSFKTGETILEEVPAPLVRKGHLLIRSSRSLVSIGTERMLVEFGKSSLISKARQQPEKVKMVLDKIKSDGLLPTLEAVFSKLEQPIPLGYCNAGVVVEVGEGVRGFGVGDRVVSNGPHAELVCIPVNLCAKIPATVSDEEACFTVIASIGLQGIRLLKPDLGETVVVYGLGLIGLIAAELLVANGCRVIGIDLDPEKIRLAEEKGIEGILAGPSTDEVRMVQDITSGIGADAVMIAASTKDSSLVTRSARMSRKRGRIVLVGVTGLELNRADFYEKELSFQVSCSYGPGRYDEDYEVRGNDYPLPFVRWTEKRNFEAVLQAIARGRLDVKPLITERVPLEEFRQIYGQMSGRKTIASILTYHENPDMSRVIQHRISSAIQAGKGLGIIGAGNYTKMTMLPALRKAKANLAMIASNAGVSGTFLAGKYGVPASTTNYRALLADSSVGMVLITTRHNLHAPMTMEALKLGKDVFVEKPLALNREELSAIEEALIESGKSLMVGFNRRFSPFVQKMKSLLGENPGQISVIATMNAGYIPPESWVHDLKQGGGRILGEACHYIDLISYLTGSLVDRVYMTALGQNPDQATDVASIHLHFRNGSIGVVNYFANGSKSYSKERLEVFFSGKNLILDNFRKMEGFGTAGFSGMKSAQDKGHSAMFAMVSEINRRGGKFPIEWQSIKNTHEAVFAAIESMQTGMPVRIA